MENPINPWMILGEKRTTIFGRNTPIYYSQSYQIWCTKNPSIFPPKEWTKKTWGKKPVPVGRFVAVLIAFETAQKLRKMPMIFLKKRLKNVPYTLED